MHPIEQQLWSEISALTWGDLTNHQWECFRIALMETESETSVQGVVLEQSGANIEQTAEMEVQGVVVEHSSSVMQTRTEMIVSIVVSDRDYLSEMLKYLPLYERKSAVFFEILRVYDREFRNIEQQLEVSERNIFLDTAIESLPIYERDLGIESVNSLRYDQRREQIASRFRTAFDQTTEEAIKSVASAYSNGEVEVNKTNTPGVYEIKFVGTLGIPNNMEGLKQALDIIVPAHLELAYTFTFNTWGMINDKKWIDASTMTWDELRTWNEVS